MIARKFYSFRKLMLKQNLYFNGEPEFCISQIVRGMACLEINITHFKFFSFEQQKGQSPQTKKRRRNN